MEQTPSLTTRLLHAGMALCVSLQLLLSTFMEMPGPGYPHSAMENIGFELHEVFGILSLLFIIAWFAWLCMRRIEAGPGELFPWFSSASRRAMFETTQNAWISLRSHDWPPANDNIRLARAVHGLGALCALGMALSGFAVWLGMSEQGQLAVSARYILDSHRALSTLMWIYVLTHAAMALLHHGRGETTLKQMFGFRQSQRIPTERVCREVFQQQRKRTMQSRNNANVRTDVSGYLIDASEWNEALAVELAEESGIYGLNERQWSVIKALRARYEAGHPDSYPLVRHVCAELGLDEECVKGPFSDPSIAWRIAGLPKSGEMHAYMPNSRLE